MSIQIGDRGTVTIPIRGADGPGEVLFDTPGGSQKLCAFATEAIPAYAPVIVYDLRPGGVDVEKARV